MSKRRRSSGNRKVAEAKFWGLPVGAPAGGGGEAAAPAGEGAEATPESQAASASAASAETFVVRPTPDPGALVRSLGPPPLAVDGGVAERHLTAVYEEAVRTATALAAANGLLASGDDDS